MNARIDLRRFHDATDVADWRLCTGCGACVYACTDGRLAMVDDVRDGLRPVHVRGLPEAATSACASCTDCLDVCPGLTVSHADATATASTATPADGPIEALREGWGTVLEIWEGWAGDDEMRAGGSSAGLASALALHAVERGGLAGVLHVGSDDAARWTNRTVLSRTRAELLARTGSRYAPASPCDGLARVEQAAAPCVFIGKPCDVEGLRKAQALRPALDAKVGLAIAIFCAGTPSTQGTLDLLARHDIAPADVQDLRYRGRGWPGTFAVKLKRVDDNGSGERGRDGDGDGDGEWRDLATYAEAWGFLQAYRPQRCHLCPDSSGEFADVSCGDPWYQDTSAHQPGLSLVLVRTERGRAAVRAAMDAGAVRLHPVGPQALERSQAELHRKRGAIWGRVLTMRAMGVPAPRLEGFSLFENWRRLPLMHQLRSVVGTARRIVTRGYRRPRSASPAGPVAEPEPVRPGVPAPPQRIDELESLRGLAALPVVLFHLPRWNEMLDGRFVRNGYLMVDLFFVLSGFVICTAYAQRLRAPRDLLRFQFLRLGRLWPVHLVFLLVFAGIEGAKYLAQQRLGLASANSTPFGVNDGTAFVENLFLVQALVPDAPLTFNYPAWSISVEVATYLLFGLVALGVAGARARTFVFAGLSAAAFVLLAAGMTFGLGPLLHGVAGFFLGAVTAAVVARGDRVVAGAWATTFAAALVALLLWKTSRAWDPLVPLLTAGLVAALVRSRDGLVKRWLRRPAWVALGALSYAVYLSHASVEWALNQAVRVVLRAPQAVTSDGVLTPQLSAGATLVAIAVVFALVLGLSAVVHRTVEAPWRARSRRYAARRWPSGGAAAVASDGAPSAV